jgi:hypothetical protein
MRLYLLYFGVIAINVSDGQSIGAAHVAREVIWECPDDRDGASKAETAAEGAMAGLIK